MKHFVTYDHQHTAITGWLEQTGLQCSYGKLRERVL